jgi:hypothetical protein
LFLRSFENCTLAGENSEDCWIVSDIVGSGLYIS